MRTEPAPTPWVLPTVDPDFPDDVIAVGADLEPGTVLAAYRQGLFPMHLDDGRLAWWSPLHRGIIPLDGLKVSRSLRRSVRRYTTSIDRAFDDVIAGCGDPSRDGRWINEEIMAAYRRLHRMGWAHSVETWEGETLVGGLYGIAIGGAFFGESMFHHATDASKVALVRLVASLNEAGFTLLDVQWVTDHLATLGAVEISRRDYLARLARAIGTSARPLA